MILKGEKLIVWDSTMQDMYAATAMKDERNELEVNPLVRVCGVICYPIQHAAMAPDRASECSPLPEGTVCRLKLICKGWLCFDSDYATSLAAARGLMMDSILARLNGYGNRLDSITNAAARAEYEALVRHAKGSYAPRTVMGTERPLVVQMPADDPLKDHIT